MDSALAPLQFEPIQTRRTFEEICERIRERVSSGELKPGDKLPAERDLAQQLGVGRNALREALRSLEIAGIVELRKGVKGGAFIRPGDPGRMDAVVRDMFSLGSISVSELTEARIHVQDLVVRLACERATEADFTALEAVIERTEAMTEAGRYLDRVECSRDFYRLLGAATHNGVLDMMVQSITEILMQFVYARVAAGGKAQPRLVQKRRAFLAALRARDSEEAARLMRSHLESVHRMLQDSLGEAGAVRLGPRPRAGR
ncbi:FadR/GntR family transcriptional regulator [Aquincola sp. MAHUQ-54]|uniref:FadR/GntR family transcriptional regulator n=2 Tax=Sphaerotilaceae TaxID=2975441 RepID=A0AAW9QAE2_9BURK